MFAAILEYERRDRTRDLGNLAAGKAVMTEPLKKFAWIIICDGRARVNMYLPACAVTDDSTAESRAFQNVLPKRSSLRSHKAPPITATAVPYSTPF